MTNLMVVCNTAAIAARFRLPLLKAALSRNYKVFCVCGEGIDANHYVKLMECLGVKVLRIPGLEHDGFSPAKLYQQGMEISKLVDRYQPQILHAFTHRANVSAYIALRTRPHVKFIANVTGAGRYFGLNLSLREKFGKEALSFLYRMMAKRCDSVFFQNNDDMLEIGGQMRLPADKSHITGGSGFDPDDGKNSEFQSVNEFRTYLYDNYHIDVKRKLILFSSRALKSKGVIDFYKAASLYLDLFDDAVFVHAGEAAMDDVHGCSEKTLKSLSREHLHFVGFQKNIFDFVNASTIVALPSRYREGIPRSLIEALYFGKIIVTTDNPGCREVVIDGWNGVQFPANSYQALLTAFVKAAAMDVKTASKNSKILFNKRFHADRVTKIYLDHYTKLLKV